MSPFEIVTEPIDRWPDANTRPRTSPAFKASYADTLEVLRRELDFLSTKGRAVVQVVTRNGATDLRRDGMLRAQAKIEHPGVRLSFTCKHGDLTYATDQFEPNWSGAMPGWQANLRAIALGLQALRTVDRYGITKSGEQYTGWLAIESGMGPEFGTADAMNAARATLLRYTPATKHGDTQAQIYRWARAGSHPDRWQGDQSHWDAVTAAGKLLGLGS
jgi:hypothetical protein